MVGEGRTSKRASGTSRCIRRSRKTKTAIFPRTEGEKAEKSDTKDDTKGTTLCRLAGRVCRRWSDSPQQVGSELAAQTVAATTFGNLWFRSESLASCNILSTSLRLAASTKEQHMPGSGCSPWTRDSRTTHVSQRSRGIPELVGGSVCFTGTIIIGPLQKGVKGAKDSPSYPSPHTKLRDKSHRC